MKLSKRNKSNQLVICILVLSILFISIGYSYLQTTLSINGDVSFDESLAVKKVKILGNDYTYYMDNVASEYVTSAKGINFNNAPSDTNGKGLYLRAGTESDEYPIYYFRGEVDNNHVIFGGFCWKIVRTTELGGTKLIYDGVPDNNQCNNTGVSTQIGTSAFNSKIDALADVGYMYGTRYNVGYEYSNVDVWVDEAFVYGSDVTYSGGTYTLTNPSSSNTMANIKTKHYTCKSTSTTCSTVYYVYYFGTKLIAHPLNGGKKIEDIINESVENKNNSAIKTTIDKWFASNLASQESKLEDAVWCNNRSIIRGGYLKDYDLTQHYGVIYFGFYEQLYVNPLVKDAEVCPNQMDRFTKSDTTRGNGALTYSVGLLTAYEATIAGHKCNTSYLYTGRNYWLLTPYEMAGTYTNIYFMSSDGTIDTRYNVSQPWGVRPSIVLKKDIVATSGDGSAEHPFIVE